MEKGESNLMLQESGITWERKSSGEPKSVMDFLSVG